MDCSALTWLLEFQHRKWNDGSPLAIVQFDVIMAAIDAHTTMAVAERRITGMVRKRGLTEIVAGGLARDTADVRENGVPAGRGGIIPNSAASGSPGAVGRPIVVGDIAITSDDIVKSTTISTPEGFS